ncbi:hypothetical protein HK100_007411 [Physocladia obscura]|uniref:Uncharacterized protein n=1 Tax=Physocladia obscura TaxID=109957 RepID=A0AAD5X8A4_9FUNG|nr:hypothetical protein HK100_007411 [Physocladia obscura]
MSAVMLAEFIVWPSVNWLHPSTTNGLICWLVLVSIQFGSTAILTTYFYMSTFRFTSHQLINNPRLVAFFMSTDEMVRHRNSIDLVTIHKARVQVEKKVLIQCIALSTSLIVCYFPFWLFSIAYTVIYVNGDVMTEDLFNGLSAVLVLFSVDAVATPMWILYFKQDIRKKIMFRKK